MSSFETSSRFLNAMFWTTLILNSSCSVPWRKTPISGMGALTTEGKWSSTLSLDATGRQAIDINLKLASALHHLASNVPSFGLLDYALQIGASSSDEFLENFCKAVCKLYKTRTLGEPTEETIVRILDKKILNADFQACIYLSTALQMVRGACSRTWSKYQR